MKKLLLILAIAGGAYYFLEPASSLDLLMEPATAAVDPERAGLEIISEGGGPGFDVGDLAEPGLFTIVEFYTEACPACKKLRGHYTQFLPLRSDVAVRRVRLPDRWGSGFVAREYGVNVKGTPHVIIYDPNGELIAADEGMDKGAYKLLYKWLDAEFKKDWERKHKG